MRLEKSLNKNVLSLRSIIGAMMERGRRVKGAISLGQGVPGEALPKYVLPEITREIIEKNDFNKYAPMAGLPDFRRDVAAHLMSRYPNHKINFEKNILITCGAAEACAIGLAAVLNPGDEVILFSPCYPSHVDHVCLSGGVPVFVNLDEKNGWALDIDKLLAAITKRTKAIIICNPVNPTGSVFTCDEMKQIVSIARKHRIFILNDETYNYLVYDPSKFCSILDVADKCDDLFINCFSFSKEFAMTGLRVGYMYISEKMFEQILKVHITVTIAAPTLSQKIGSIMLRHKKEWSGPYFETFKRKRQVLMDELDKISDFVSYHPPLGAYYLFVKYRLNASSQKVAIRLLEEACVITIPGFAFGPAGEKHLRLSFAGDMRGMIEAAKRFRGWFEGL